MSGRRPGSMTATELLAEKERRLREDPEFRAAWEGAEAERARAVAERRAAAEPVLVDLAPLGYTAQRWHVADRPPSEAVPVLLRHLGKDHPDHVLAWTTRILGQAKPVEHWEELANRYVDIPPEKSEYKDAMAATLSEIAQQRHMPLVRQLLVDTSLGVSRIHFYRTLTRTRAADRWALIEAGLDDPDLKKEAAHLLHQRQLRATRRRR
jgi:hypothetical protein